MNTPICDFISDYKDKCPKRLHMPGHKGVPFLGAEPYDITEIVGADSLYEADGIIRESEKNAGSVFGCRTYYSAEGSSLCIRAMLYLAALRYGSEKPLIAAGRNAHKSFLSAAALLDFDIDWLCDGNDSYLSCKITPEALEAYFLSTKRSPCAVYLTSPDYLGNMLDIRKLSEVCHRHDVLLLVDNAHGAYLKLLPKSLHPMDLGADICCDSAHKTLPVLTGGAYLHLSHSAPPISSETVRNALMLFGSTSPSYLILQSLDMANTLMGDFAARLAEFSPRLFKLREQLRVLGYDLIGDEPLKLTLSTKPYGYEGNTLADILARQGFFCEFSDSDFLVMMFSPLSDDITDELYTVLSSVPKKNPLRSSAPRFSLPERKMSPREAVMSPCERVSIENAVGRVIARAEVCCPPAVPIAVCGELITEPITEAFRYYGITELSVTVE